MRTRARRHFLKPLARDGRSSTLFATALLLDAGPTPIVLHAISAFASDMANAKKQHSYARFLMHGYGDRNSQCLRFPGTTPADAQRYPQRSVILKPFA
jgi:hypothetical protein